MAATVANRMMRFKLSPFFEQFFPDTGTQIKEGGLSLYQLFLRRGAYRLAWLHATDAPYSLLLRSIHQVAEKGELSATQLPVMPILGNWKPRLGCDGAVFIYLLLFAHVLPWSMTSAFHVLLAVRWSRLRSPAQAVLE